MKHLLFLSLFFTTSILHAAPSNSANTISGWVYYDFLSIEDKMEQGRYAEVEADYLDLLDNTCHLDHLIMLLF